MGHRVACLVLILAACGGGRTGPPPPDPARTTGPGAAGILACQSTVRAIDALSACPPTPEERELTRRSMASLRDLHGGTAPLSADTVPVQAAGCVHMLDDLVEGLRWLRCPFQPTAIERAWIHADRTRRTAVPAAADADTRRALGVLVGLRDRGCACKDVACSEAIDREVNAAADGIGGLKDRAMADVGAAIYDELAGCARRLRVATEHAGPPPPPTDPAVVRRQLAALDAAAAAERAEQAAIAAEAAAEHDADDEGEDGDADGGGAGWVPGEDDPDGEEATP